MSNYVDGFVLPLAKNKVEAYRNMAEKAAAVWKEHGALDYWECVGDDLDSDTFVPFPKIANAAPDETVVLAWIVFLSREHRDEVNAKVMADPRLSEMCGGDDPIFDYKRMAYGGFKPIVRLE